MNDNIGLACFVGFVGLYVTSKEYGTRKVFLCFLKYAEGVFQLFICVCKVLIGWK